MDHTPSQYLLEMPARVLFAEARVIERWCAENNRCRPTLLDLGTAREWRSSERRSA
jgi:hypothetical protein